MFHGKCVSYGVHLFYCTVKGREFVGTFRRKVLSEHNSVTWKIETPCFSVHNLYINDELSQKASIQIVVVVVVGVVAAAVVV